MTRLARRLLWIYIFTYFTVPIYTIPVIIIIVAFYPAILFVYFIHAYIYIPITVFHLSVYFEINIIKSNCSEDHAIGLSTFTIMAGLGGSLGYLMGAIDWGWVGKKYVSISFSTIKISTFKAKIKIKC